MLERIIKLAALLGGVSEESESLRALCGSAQTELAGKLRPGLEAETCEGFDLAAAWMALADLAEGEGEAVSSFAAGEVSVKLAEGGGKSERLRSRARELMKPWLADGGFDFRSVRY